MITKLRAEAKYMRKALVMLANVAGLAISQTLVTGTAAKVVGIALAVGATYGVWRVPNAQPEDHAPTG